MTLISRIGCFFTLVGMVLVAIFIASDLSQQRDYNYLLVGGLAFFIGYAVYRSGKPPAQPSGRFSALRKVSEQFQSRRKKPGSK
ncbi:MAG: hypothetical protein ABFD44_04620 [Anaerolineaceae bacterium]